MATQGAARPIDALEASKMARAYVEALVGPIAVYDFKVESAGKEAGNWKVVCSYMPFPTRPLERRRYTFVIDAKSGDFLQTTASES